MSVVASLQSTHFLSHFALFLDIFKRFSLSIALFPCYVCCSDVVVAIAVAVAVEERLLSSLLCCGLNEVVNHTERKPKTQHNAAHQCNGFILFHLVPFSSLFRAIISCALVSETNKRDPYTNQSIITHVHVHTQTHTHTHTNTSVCLKSRCNTYTRLLSAHEYCVYDTAFSPRFFLHFSLLHSLIKSQLFSTQRCCCCCYCCWLSLSVCMYMHEFFFPLLDRCTHYSV